MAIYYNCYPMYGLNKYRSFLEAPKCDCGCGNSCHILLKDEEDVEDFCCAMLLEHECPDSAIFAVFKNGKHMAVFKEYDDDEEVMTILKGESYEPHFFAELDGEMRFCCYNLIVEEKPGKWMIR